jgi:hypothetical protein
MSFGTFNTIATHAQIHRTAYPSSHYAISASILLVSWDKVLEDYTVIYSLGAEKRQ